MTADPSPSGDREPFDVEEGGGPPIGQPWTLVVTGDDGWSADLEHAAPLPRIGERVEVIEEDGVRRMYRVRDVVHTVQPSSSERPRVRDETGGPNATVSAANHPRHEPTALRAGLPRVEVAPED